MNPWSVSLKHGWRFLSPRLSATKEKINPQKSKVCNIKMINYKSRMEQRQWDFFINKHVIMKKTRDYILCNKIIFTYPLVFRHCQILNWPSVRLKLNAQLVSGHRTIADLHYSSEFILTCIHHWENPSRWGNSNKYLLPCFLFHMKHHGDLHFFHLFIISQLIILFKIIFVNFNKHLIWCI